MTARDITAVVNRQDLADLAQDAQPPRGAGRGGEMDVELARPDLETADDAGAEAEE